MPDGTPFPARDLAIFLAAGVIIVSLVAASIGLPHLLKGLRLPPAPSEDRRENIARVAAARAAIKAIQHELGQGRSDANLYAEAGARLMDLYRDRIDGRTKTGEDAELVRHIEDIEHKLRVEGLKAERDELFRLSRSQRIPEDVIRKLVREVDFVETRYAQ
jgi:CPA1 family monovalent cation:H+ antiporter